jgi:endonuclease III
MDATVPRALEADVRCPAVARPRGAKSRVEIVERRLAELYPDVQCALVHSNPYELLVATILSAQSTDVRVNRETPALFAEYPTPADLAAADPERVEVLVHATGFFRAKTRSIIGMAQAVVERFDGEIPRDLDDLVTLPGVGRKTGNVVRSVAFDLPGLPVDTHVTRLSHRLELTNETDAVKIELDLNALVAPEDRGRFSLRLIEHGRRVCDARRPRCDDCVLAPDCPSAFTFAPVKKAAPKQRVAKPPAAAKKRPAAEKVAAKPKPKPAARR